MCVKFLSRRRPKRTCLKLVSSKKRAMRGSKALRPAVAARKALATNASERVNSVFEPIESAACARAAWAASNRPTVKRSHRPSRGSSEMTPAEVHSLCRLTAERFLHAARSPAHGSHRPRQSGRARRRLSADDEHPARPVDVGALQFVDSLAAPAHQLAEAAQLDRVCRARAVGAAPGPAAFRREAAVRRRRRRLSGPLAAAAVDQYDWRH